LKVIPAHPRGQCRGLDEAATYRRTNHANLHVRGEEGTITTPFDMTVLNEADRFHLVMDVIDRLPPGPYPQTLA
jgi:xylulose-5-phosphate/fructose-6-phosphate phosphoketolase